MLKMSQLDSNLIHGEKENNNNKTKEKTEGLVWLPDRF